MSYCDVLAYTTTVENPNYLLGGFECKGKESSLVECTHSGWGKADKCSGSQGNVAAVECIGNITQKHPAKFNLDTCKQKAMLQSLIRIGIRFKLSRTTCRFSNLIYYPHNIIKMTNTYQHFTGDMVCYSISYN